MSEHPMRLAMLPGRSRAAFRKLYRSIPFKRQIFTLAKRFGTPSERIFRHLHFEGTFPVRIDASKVSATRISTSTTPAAPSVANPRSPRAIISTT